MLAGKRVLLGVTGGIAAYQAADLIGLLQSRLVDVRVIMTPAATRFVTPLTLETISRHPVTVEMFTEGDHSRVEHISLAQSADLVVIAPATGNFIGKVASGIADDMLTTTVMASPAPCIICPAMNEVMWHNTIVQENVQRLRDHGYQFVEPEFGPMACGGEGWGRLAALSSILSAAITVARDADANPDSNTNANTKTNTDETADARQHAR